MATIKVVKLKRKTPVPPKGTQLVIMGLTPGHQQHAAINAAKFPREGAFAGQMRIHLHDYFERLKINSFFDVATRDSFYVEKKFDKIVYTTSLLADPVYKDGENYTGRSPYPWKHEQLFEMMEMTFKRIGTIRNACLIVPLGDIVSRAILEYSDLDENHFVMHGFPHPSGANGSKAEKFERHYENLKAVFKAFKKANAKA